MSQTIALAIVAVVLAGPWPGARPAEQKFPGKGTLTIVTGPVAMFIHYLDGSGKPVELRLRDLSYAEPDLTLSKQLNALSKRPCGVGDVVNINRDPIAAHATGLDAAGIGRFSWLISGQYTSDGKRWWFKGRVQPMDGPYKFDKQDFGSRDFMAEVSTRIGSTFHGAQFSVTMTGSLPVSIDGICSLTSAGQGLV
jgi:hypothetical protein